MASSSSFFAYSNAFLPSQPFHLLHPPPLSGTSSEVSRELNEPSDDSRTASTASALSSFQEAFQTIYQAVLTILTPPEPQAQLPSISVSPSDYDSDMSSASYSAVPGTPGVIAPTPESSSVETSTKSNGGYFSRRPVAGPDPSERARTLDRTDSALRRRRTSQLASPGDGLHDGTSPKSPISEPSLDENHLAPASPASKYTRHTFSRSPSPLGLIPIHRNWRKFVCSMSAFSSFLFPISQPYSNQLPLHQIHKHEIPRKLLHVSIGFLTLYLYAIPLSPSQLHPILLRFLLPIALTDLLRFRYPPLNTFYIRALGPLMRESEAHDKYNGVIWYLLGTWSVLRFCPKDIGVVSICLLSWCDTAASTIGRKYGRYTPQVRRGKSLAGSVAATVVGVMTGWLFWGWWAPACSGRVVNEGVDAFAFNGMLGLPQVAREALGWSTEKATITGGMALGVMSVVAGVIASASEAVDLWGLDDNVTIPVLAGMGLWAFLKVFGQA